MAPTVSSAPHEGDTSIALATLVPYSSDGPTLPLIGNSSTERAKRTNGGKRETSDRNEAAAVKKAKTADNETLYTPWVLLPPEMRRSVAERLGSTWDWETHCVPIVYTRNQNITSGLNRLKLYLGHSCTKDSAIEVPDSLKGNSDDSSPGSECGVIAISAQADATTKLVGIIELAKRVVAGSDTTMGHGRKVVWYSYTSLSSRLQRIEVRDGEKTKERETEAAHASDESEPDFERKERAQGGEKTRKVPILTVWMTKRRIEEFRRAFGEQTFEVHTIIEDE